eukprot:TRINITY_DN1999_c1_g6_i1.p1 TRINITY_DN1999_c1_g6~~TRINITY_DN1999_c1_g6_i1.p1  ORF type:complete len:611 (+),score=167.81 TRINITY_DN1999_c1_g6_i1:78-1910(+)
MADGLGDIFFSAKQKLQSIKNTVLNVPEIVQKVEEATSIELWGASSTLMYEIADATFSYQDYNLISGSLWSRINDPKSKWTIIYKGLTLAEFIAINGHERCHQDLQNHSYEIKKFTTFEFVDENLVDRGLSVREKAKKLMELSSDAKKFQDERAKAEKNRGKYAGVSSDGSRGFGSDSVGAAAPRSKYSGFSSNNMSSMSSESYSANSYSSSSYTAPKRDEHPSQRSSAPVDVSGSEGEEETPKPTPKAAVHKASSQPKPTTTSSSATKTAAAPKATTASNLIDFDFGGASTNTPSSANTAQAAAKPANLLDDLVFGAPAPPPAAFQAAQTQSSTQWADFGAFQSAPATQKPAPTADLFDFNPRATAAPATNTSGFGEDWGAFSSGPMNPPAQQQQHQQHHQQQQFGFAPQYQQQQQQQQFGFAPQQQQSQPFAFSSQQPQTQPLHSHVPTFASAAPTSSSFSSSQGFSSSQPTASFGSAGFQDDFGAFESSDGQQNQQAGSKDKSGSGLSSLLTTHAKLLNLTDMDSKKQQAATLPATYKSTVPLNSIGQKMGSMTLSGSAQPHASSLSGANVPMNAMRPTLQQQQQQQQQQAYRAANPANPFGSSGAF